jgi:hypothetical protein
MFKFVFYVVLSVFQPFFKNYVKCDLSKIVFEKHTQKKRIEVAQQK